ncbi:hypothetical protein Sipo8835_07390 [Streptomyces ipomoeae]|uniref:Uncharacterized protein n=1 Tax=Streptomyces ipomoeae TaxID=103232 RepID=A0AAE8W6V9_9ACTN|nr:hypothetical protein [Streptomyces ipomoeae]MDX2695223.1 hypothetical protein [Streptomyces ipomoeae]MDX2823858.1 hypothetical protein [Streptomyces ipomoeae]MDX2837711.1 hypothetical protein [Streptomyces ipomoeae]MDX2873442.1 hypothetical protein [Streptomyces ipomoeae]TQE37540.1 hypothetical protein Sipo8835_07390 [Streptomyces ipomoeae]
MQDPSDSMEIAEPEENGRSNTADSPVVDDPTPHSDIDSTTASTVLAEVLPGVAVVFGEVPAELKPDLIDFGLVSVADRKQISTVLASIGNTTTVAGNLGNAFAGVQGLYRISDATQALLRAGGTLAVKDGANLGAVFLSGRIAAQARFIPVTAVSAAQTAATLGPALAMVALQMQLSEITGLVRTNIALTSQVLTTIRNEQWAELTGLVATVDRAVDQAREVGSVPTSLWDSVAGGEASLRKQLDLYRLNVRGHVGQIDRPDTRRHREYLQTNAEAIVFDAYALLSSVKAWTGYQALRAGRARAAGREDADEARLVDVIARDTRTELDSALAETRSLVASLTRELRIITELPGRDTLSQSLTGKRRDSKAARQTSARLLEAIEPLADALHPPAPPLEAPGVVCAPESLDLEPYLRILRWFLEDGETLRVLGFPDQLDALGPISAILGGAKEKLAAARDRAVANTLVAVTDRRIITAKTNAFLEQGEIRQDIPIDQVRYVRAATAQDRSARLAIDLITRDESIRWLFRADIDNTQVDALAAVLAESMTIPDVEREELQRRRYAPIEAGKKSESTGTRSTEPTGPEATTCDAE